MNLVPTRQTLSLAAKMIHVASDEGADAVRHVADLERGQELALLAVLLGFVTGSGNHRGPGPIRLPLSEPEPLTMLACPTCLALIHEPCRTRNGHTRVDHGDRIIPRRCRCGEPIPRVRGRKWCDDCQVEVRRAQQQRYDAVRKPHKAAS